MTNAITIGLSDFYPLLPALVMLVGGCALLMAEVFMSGHARGHQPIIATFFSVVAGVAAAWTLFQPARQVFGGFGVQDPFSSFLSLVVCIGLLLSVLLAAGFLRHRKAERGEFYA